jgi:hypothetical protein
VITLNVIQNGAYGQPEWKVYETVVDSQTFKIPYRITNGDINKIEVDFDFNALILFVEADHRKDGIFEITVPRNIADPKQDGADDIFIVLVDGDLAEYQEVRNSNCFRILSLPILASSKVIEIGSSTGVMDPRHSTHSEVLPIYVSTEKTSYEVGERINISGCTNLALSDKEVILKILNPEGETFRVLPVVPDVHGSFSSSLIVEGEHAINGTYTLEATYADKTNTSTFVVPEFPLAIFIFPIALVLLLAVRFVFRANLPKF